MMVARSRPPEDKGPMSARGLVVLLICAASIGIIAARLIIWRISTPAAIEVLVDLDESEAAGVRLRFTVANPSAGAAMSQIRYECAFDFPDVALEPGAITSVTVAADRGDAIAASQKREFQCIPFVPPGLKSPILVHVLFFYRGGPLGADRQETVFTPSYRWAEEAGKRGWVEVKEDGLPTSPSRCHPRADPLGLCRIDP
jgi:hypothetical protein